jgi:hypothetical protein
VKLCVSQEADHLPGKPVAVAGDVGDFILQASIGCIIASKRLWWKPSSWSAQTRPPER